MEKAVDYCQDYRTDARIAECDSCSTVITSCDSCHRNDIEEVRAGLNVLAGDVEQYETCEDLKTRTINSVVSVSADIDALVLALVKDDTMAWQAAFTEYRMPCSSIPLRYCDSMTAGTHPACSTCNDQCQQIDEECTINSLDG